MKNNAHAEGSGNAHSIAPEKETTSTLVRRCKKNKKQKKNEATILNAIFPLLCSLLPSKPLSPYIACQPQYRACRPSILLPEPECRVKSLSTVCYPRVGNATADLYSDV